MCIRDRGTVLVECGRMLEKGGYVIKSLNTINFRKSMHYNPFSLSLIHICGGTAKETVYGVSVGYSAVRRYGGTGLRGR